MKKSIFNISTALGLIFLTHAAYGMNGEEKPKKFIVHGQKKPQDQEERQDQEGWSQILLTPKIINRIVFFCEGHRNTVSLISKVFLHSDRNAQFIKFKPYIISAEAQKYRTGGDPVYLYTYPPKSPTGKRIRTSKIMPPPFFKNFPGLTSLDLSSNQGVDGSCFPSGCLPNLKSLSLNNANALCGPLVYDRTLSKFTMLETLKIKDNRLITTKAISHLTGLTALNIGEKNKIEGSILLKLRKLRKLSIQNNTAILGEILSQLTGLQTLDISGWTNISDDNLISLTNLKKLKIQGTSCDISSAALQPLSALQTLDVSYNKKIDMQDLKKLPSLSDLTVYKRSPLHDKELLELLFLKKLTIRNFCDTSEEFEDAERPGFYKDLKTQGVQLFGIPTGQTKGRPL